MDILPVRTSSFTPNWRSIPVMASIFSSSPVTSMIMERWDTSMILARKMFTICMISERVCLSALTLIKADMRTTRQIIINLIGNAIRLAQAGGQVIVSTALTDDGAVAIRVRDTGAGMTDGELAAALEPFRSPSPVAGDGVSTAGFNLSLTKALAEANRARLAIRSGSHAGTLAEVVFDHSA